MGTADVPLFALAVRRQDECALARSNQDPYFAHRPLLPGFGSGLRAGFTAPPAGEAACLLSSIGTTFDPRKIDNAENILSDMFPHCVPSGLRNRLAG